VKAGEREGRGEGREGRARSEIIAM